MIDINIADYCTDEGELCCDVAVVAHVRSAIGWIIILRR